MKKKKINKETIKVQLRGLSLRSDNILRWEGQDFKQSIEVMKLKGTIKKNNTEDEE